MARSMEPLMRWTLHQESVQRSTAPTTVLLLPTHRLKFSLRHSLCLLSTLGMTVIAPERRPTAATAAGLPLSLAHRSLAVPTPCNHHAPLVLLYLQQRKAKMIMDVRRRQKSAVLWTVPAIIRVVGSLGSC
jgi:hypothetical protein